MNTAIDLQFTEVTSEYQRQCGEERYFRRVDKSTWVSCLYRRNSYGPGFFWETAVVTLRDPSHPDYKRRGEWDDRDMVMLNGNYMDELAFMSGDEVRRWAAEHA